MKYSILKAAVCASTATLLLGYGAAAGAHTVSQSLGTGSKADIYSVSCDNEEGGDTPTYRLSARVIDLAPTPAPDGIVGVRITKDGVSVIKRDTNGDGNNSWSAWARVAQGNGLYTVKVNKTSGGSELYRLELHCEGPQSSGYIHTGTSVTLIQNR